MQTRRALAFGACIAIPTRPPPGPRAQLAPTRRTTRRPPSLRTNPRPQQPPTGKRTVIGGVAVTGRYMAVARHHVAITCRYVAVTCRYMAASRCVAVPCRPVFFDGGLDGDGECAGCGNESGCHDPSSPGEGGGFELAQEGGGGEGANALGQCLKGGWGWGQEWFICTPPIPGGEGGKPRTGARLRRWRGGLCLQSAGGGGGRGLFLGLIPGRGHGGGGEAAADAPGERRAFCFQIDLLTEGAVLFSSHSFIAVGEILILASEQSPHYGEESL